MNTIYYQPEKYGLDVVAELDTNDSVGYNKVMVWRRQIDGVLVWSAESGCSCPVPFEDAGINDLRPLLTTRDAFEAAITEARRYKEDVSEAVNRFRRRVADATRARGKMGIGRALQDGP